MTTLSQFTILTSQHDNALFDIFKNIIDEAKAETEKNWLDSISAFIFVIDNLESAYAHLAMAMGIIATEKEYNEGLNKFIVSEKLSERIYTYLEPITQAAREDIKKKAEEDKDAFTLSELHKKYGALNSLLSNKTLQQNSYVYEGISFVKI